MDIKNFLNKMAYSNIIISLGPVSLVVMTNVLLSLNNFNPLLFLPPFLIAFFVYSFNRFADLKKDRINNPERTEFVKEKGNLFFNIGILSLILALVISFLVSFMVFLIILIPAILVTIYSINWLPTTYVKRFKELFLLKNIIVALGWSLIPFYVAFFL